jgi:formate dehydrogenase
VTRESHVGRRIARGNRPSYCSTLVEGQAPYAAGTREILECRFDGRPLRNEYLIVEDGQLAGTGAKSYTVANDAGASQHASPTKKLAG